MSKLNIIGAGAMGSAIARGLIKSGLYAGADLLLFDLREETLIKLSQELNCQYSLDLSKLKNNIEKNSILLFAVKPQNIQELFTEFNGVDSSVLILSILAGTKLANFEKTFKSNPIIRIMPNTPAQISKGISVLAPNSKVQANHLTTTQNIFASLGEVLVLEESYMDLVTAISGSGPAYVFLLVEAMTNAGLQLGLDLETSKILARHTVYGAANLLIESGEEASKLREMVTSPKGTTQTALDSFNKNHFQDIVLEAITAAKQRSQELAL